MPRTQENRPIAVAVPAEKVPELSVKPPASVSPVVLPPTESTCPGFATASDAKFWEVADPLIA